MSIKVTWSDHLHKKLHSLSRNPTDTDVLLKVGDDEIPVHSWILKLNSNLMNPSKMLHSDVSNQTLVYLNTDFTIDIVQQVITSFYTGEINLDCNLKDLKSFYKFAMIYCVEWLLEHTMRKLTDLVEADFHTFIEVYKFAISIFCEPLKERCLSKIDEARIDALISDPTVADYGLIKNITLLGNTPEIKIFDLVCKWYELDTKERQESTSQLLKNIKFERMSHADCKKVTDWVFDVASNEIDDSTCMKITKAVHKRLKEPDADLSISDSSPSTSNPSSSNPSTSNPSSSTPSSSTPIISTPSSSTPSTSTPSTPSKPVDPVVVITDTVREYIRQKRMNDHSQKIKDLTLDELVLCVGKINFDEELKKNFCEYLFDNRERFWRDGGGVAGSLLRVFPKMRILYEYLGSAGGTCVSRRRPF